MKATSLPRTAVCGRCLSVFRVESDTIVRCACAIHNLGVTSRQLINALPNQEYIVISAEGSAVTSKPFNDKKIAEEAAEDTVPGVFDQLTAEYITKNFSNLRDHCPYHWVDHENNFTRRCRYNSRNRLGLCAHRLCPEIKR